MWALPIVVILIVIALIYILKFDWYRKIKKFWK